MTLEEFCGKCPSCLDCLFINQCEYTMKPGKSDPEFYTLYKDCEIVEVTLFDGINSVIVDFNKEV